MSNITPVLPGHFAVSEPELLFHYDRPQDRDAHPLRGLLRFGPYSRGLVNAVLDPIRIATIYPYGFRDKVRKLFEELEQRHQPRERKNYLPEFPGFSRVFGLRLAAAEKGMHVQLPELLNEQIRSANKPHMVLADALTKAMNQIFAFRHEYDVLVIFESSQWEAGFYGDRTDDFDLHDYVKAVNASRGISTQMLEESSALDYFCRASVMWRLGIALYCKAGGVPWKLADTDPEAAYIGLSYALKSSENDVSFVTCCSQVFDSDGAGLEFIAYETNDVRSEGDNPFLSRTEMRRVMARSLALYQRRHAGRGPKRVVIHKTTEFKPDEVEGCFDAWSSTEGVELYQIQQDTVWRGVLIERDQNSASQGIPAAYPCHRGTYLQLGTREVLVWTQGDVPIVADGKHYFKEGKGIPHPILLKRYSGHGGWDEPVRAILGLTKMNWNNDSLYDRLPVTLGYASTLARTIKRMPTILSKPYEFRLFM
jgi:hypothetical protein